jgi:two-component system cell cycle response regulator
MAFMALDLDRFKTVNDTHGHPAGDAVLIEISRRLRDALRPRDMLARVGGEEFWIALPDTNAQTATKAAQALRQLVRENPIVLPDRRGLLRMTISIGVSVADPADISCVRDIDQLQESADSALYNAKANGRDKVTFASFAA